MSRTSSRLRVHREDVLDMFHDRFRLAEYVDQVNRLSDLRQLRPYLLAQDRLVDELRIHSDDSISLILEVFRHIEGRLLRLAMDPQHSNRRRPRQDLPQAGVIDGGHALRSEE